MDYLEIEELLFEALFKHRRKPEAEEKKAKYILAKSILFSDILPWIKTAEPNLSDHGPDHIDNVLQNAFQLIEPEIRKLVSAHSCEKFEFTSLDLYYLCLSILFHDVGNIFGREKHNITIPEVVDGRFSSLFPKTGKDKKERVFIIQAGRVHTGKAKDKTKDTLKDLKSNSLNHINGEPIRLLDIATILRFADELAEGPQRTSSYMRDIGGFDQSSAIFHQYAECTDLLIDRSNERISIHYQIPIGSKELATLNKPDIEALLNFMYQRLMKLEEERKYNRFYSPFLAPFKRTVANIEFVDPDSFPHDFRIDEIELNDLIVPGTSKKEKKSLVDLKPELEPKILLERLEKSIGGVS